MNDKSFIEFTRVLHKIVQALSSVWKDYHRHQGVSQQKELDDILISTELVLDSHHQLIEINRVPGENDVSVISDLTVICSAVDICGR